MDVRYEESNKLRVPHLALRVGLAGFLGILWDRASASLQRLIDRWSSGKRAISINCRLAAGFLECLTLQPTYKQ
ncbi:hypothetical protein PputUW4_03592 [Pseudomonas sp. UW4]|nr:hypothetical protein PputUW4_03592 [Pseudomonas sp. UW4]